MLLSLSKVVKIAPSSPGHNRTRKFCSSCARNAVGSIFICRARVIPVHESPFFVPGRRGERVGGNVSSTLCGLLQHWGGVRGNRSGSSCMKLGPEQKGYNIVNHLVSTPLAIFSEHRRVMYTMMRGRFEMWVGHPPLPGTGRRLFEPVDVNAKETHRFFSCTDAVQ